MYYSKIVAVTNRHICYQKHIEEYSPVICEQITEAFPMLTCISESERTKCCFLIKRIIELVKLQIPTIILREKDMPCTDYRILAEICLAVCKDSNTGLILHSFVEAAMELNAPYLHLPLNLLQAIKSTSTLQEEKIPSYLDSLAELGVSVHSIEDAKLAQRLGATYITAGHIYDTSCKKGLPGRGLPFLSEICNSVGIPVYGIGGISSQNLNDVLSAGAAGGCIMSGLM